MTFVETTLVVSLSVLLFLNIFLFANHRHVSVHTAKAVVIFSCLNHPRKSDALTLRIIIAISVVGLAPNAHMVAEVRDPGEMDKIIRFTGGEQLETVHSNDLNTRVSLSAVKQPGKEPKNKLLALLFIQPFVLYNCVLCFRYYKVLPGSLWVRR